MSLLRTFTIALAAAAATVLFMGLLGPASGPRAGTALRLDIEELVERSDLVLEGRVLSATPVMGASGRLETDYLMTVDRTLWGQHEGTRVLRLPGGVLPDGSGLMLAGMPRLAAGEELVLMLTEAGRGELRVPVGLAQGRFTLHHGLDGTRTLVREQGSLQLVDQSSGRVQSADSRSILDYAETMGRIEAAANRKRVAALGRGR
ncbi:MAG: hypothetical protein QF724_03125 [Planctomycetota bacterium]|nr:hypothetical protein [Planctomycetota bacterium]MDP6368365.1 hypothetical protein [Planctomycetota bacterium]MDP6519304.1 hypothetical protein [Planctomycetota bacterium]MDP6837903.1 hypothetical protein [Planctomycetota bacterium]MDP6955071.1 hypothetical protein [Planctomycetota bacterium]